MTFTVQSDRRLYAASLVVSSEPTVDSESGVLAKASWVLPWPTWTTGVHMQEVGAAPPTYSYTAYANDYYPFLLTAGTYYWQVTASLSDPTAAQPELVVGPVETLTVNGPDIGPPASPPTSGWGGPTSMGFPGQRLPIAFRLASASQTISNVAYAGRMFCEGIPEELLPVGGEVAGSAPLAAGSRFDFLAPRVYPAPPNGPGMQTVLHVAGSIDGQQVHGTLDERRGPECRTPQATWSALPAYAGVTSQHLPVVGLVTRRHRIDRLMLVWRSDCLSPWFTNPKSWETLWLDLRHVRVRGGRFLIWRVFALRNAEGDTFRVSANVRGKLGSQLIGMLRARARNIGPMASRVSKSQAETCDSGKVRFAVTR